MKLYQVVEIRGKKRSSYIENFESDKELANWLEFRMAFENPSRYSITAWSINNDGYGWINMKKYGYSEVALH